MRAAPFEDRTEPVDCARVQCGEAPTVVLQGLDYRPGVFVGLWLLAALVITVGWVLLWPGRGTS